MFFVGCQIFWACMLGAVGYYITEFFTERDYHKEFMKHLIESE
jgi:hypothetical protein